METDKTTEIFMANDTLSSNTINMYLRKRNYIIIEGAILNKNKNSQIIL